MNLVQIDSPTLCIIVETNEEKFLYPMYDIDNSDKKFLTIIESQVGGKFYGWKDLETGKIYKKRDEAYAKPKTPYELFGKECGSGWDELINPLMEYIEKYNNEHPTCKIEITQIKEKFGGLRFYVENEPEEFREMIREAEDESFKVCEVCGARKNVGHTLGWIQTICADCLTKQVNDPNCIIKEKKWRPVNGEEVIIFKKEKDENSISSTR